MVNSSAKIGTFFIILAIAAAESVIGLVILTVYYRLNNTIRIDKIKNIKG